MLSCCSNANMFFLKSHDIIKWSSVWAEELETGAPDFPVQWDGAVTSETWVPVSGLLEFFSKQVKAFLRSAPSLGCMNADLQGCFGFCCESVSGCVSEGGITPRFRWGSELELWGGCFRLNGHIELLLCCYCRKEKPFVFKRTVCATFHTVEYLHDSSSRHLPFSDASTRVLTLF